MNAQDKKQTIVMVDDNLASLKAGQVILKEHYHIFPVPSGEKLFELLENISPDLILLDVEMPGMGGYEVLKNLKSSDSTRDIPVIFLTALSDTQNQLEGLNLGAIDYFFKPLSAPLLLKRVENQLLIISQTRELKKVNEELRKAMQQAEAANLAKSTFLAHISHEIRTPMNAIIGMSELMRLDNLDGVQKNYLRDIQDMSKSLLKIINDILDLSKIEAGKMDILPVHFRLKETFNHLCSAYRFLAVNKDLEFRSYFDPEIPEVVYTDEIRIRQLVNNILGNSLKYTRQGFVELRIEMSVRNGQNWLAISVEDSGIGIKKEDYGKIFHRFQQLDEEQNRNIQGTGLGLSITRKLAEMMGGTIWFESEYGKGSIFTILLPLVPGDSKKVKDDHYFEKIIATADIPVLVVDDNPVNLTVAQGFLQTHNIKAETASSGEEAIRMIKDRIGAVNSSAEPYALVFMDHMMPNMDGIETTRHIREWEKENQRPALPIVALTANAVMGMERMFLGAGLNGFLSKPMNANALNTVLARWLPPDRISIVEPEPLTESYDESSYGVSYDTPKKLAEEKLLEELSLIAGLDTTAGLSNIGQNRESYFLALRQFVENCDFYLEDLILALNVEKWNDYTVRAHALKGVLAAFGAGRLSSQAARLESASKDSASNEEIEICRAETAPFSIALGDFRDKLKAGSLFSPFGGEDEKKDKPEGEEKFLREQMDLLKKACMECSTGEAEKISAAIGNYTWGAETDRELEKILRFIVSYDYDKVPEGIERFLESYRPMT